MKIFKCLIVCFAILADVAVAFGQTGTVGVFVSSPASNARVADSVYVAVSTGSTYEIQTIQVQYAGRNVDLVFSPLNNWTNTLSLVGLPHGSIPLTIVATDDFGTTGQATVTVVHDTPPTLTVSTPPNGTVARPGLSVSFSSTDDGPAGSSLVVEQASDYSGGPVLVSGSNLLTTNISLTAYDGNPVSLMFRATDSANQLTATFRQVYAQSSTNFVEVARVSEGHILDVHSDRILFLVDATDATGPFLKIQSRADASESVIFHQPLGISTSFLAPGGAVSVVTGTLVGSANGNAVYQFQSGTVTNQASVFNDMSLHSRGNYAAWTWDAYGGYPQIGLINLTTATSQVVTNYTNGGAFRLDVAANGDVVFAGEDISGNSHSIFRYRAGTITLLATDPANKLDYPKTDGTNVFFIQTTSTNQSLILVTDAGQSTVAQGAMIGTDLLVNNGWVAYEKSTGSSTQVWRRSPDGTATQLTFYGASSYLTALNPYGEVAFFHGSQLFISKGIFPAPALAASGPDPGINSGLTIFWLDDRWYASLGRSLFQIYTSTPAIAMPHVAANLFNLDLVGAVGQHIITQTSTDRIHWTDISTNAIADGTNMTLQVPLDTQAAAHFYRVHTQ